MSYYSDKSLNSDVLELHKVTSRHVAKAEADTTEDNVRHIFHESNLVRIAKNELSGIMQSKLNSYHATKKFKKLSRLYGIARENGNEKERKSFGKQLTDLSESFGLAKEVCRKEAEKLKNKYGLSGVLGFEIYEDLWKAVESNLYGKGKRIHFSKKTELPALRGKQIDKENVLKVNKDDSLMVKHKDIAMGLKFSSDYEKREFDEIKNYMKNSEDIDRYAIDLMKNNNVIESTYRPCYITLVPEVIRGKNRVFVQTMTEGKALPKLDKNGNPKHKLGEGRVACDVGTQDVFYTSNSSIGVFNLGDDDALDKKYDSEERRLLRKMDRSKRSTNPQNINADGTFKKRSEITEWKHSKNYKKTRAKLKEISRKRSIHRHSTVNKDVNELRALGNEFITEPSNASELMKNATELEKDARGRYKSKHRKGKVIQHHCSGYFVVQSKSKFENTNGTFDAVDKFKYRATQYDFTNQTYTKHEEKERVIVLSNGMEVDRDAISSLNLYCMDTKTRISQSKIKEIFYSWWYSAMLDLAEEIQITGRKIKNSGLYKINVPKCRKLLAESQNPKPPPDE